jgi:hypothetical protein
LPFGSRRHQIHGVARAVGFAPRRLIKTLTEEKILAAPPDAPSLPPRINAPMSTIDIRPLMAAINDPEKLGQISALSAMADELAQRDERYAVFAGAIGEIWSAMVARNPLKARRAVDKLLDECDRLSLGK